MSNPTFWDVYERAQEDIQTVKTLKAWVEPFERLAQRVRDTLELDEILDLVADVLSRGDRQSPMFR